MDPPISEVGKWEVGVSAKHEALPYCRMRGG